MAELTYRDAVARGIAQEMKRDPDVIFIGEDVGKVRTRWYAFNFDFSFIHTLAYKMIANVEVF